MKKTIAAGKRGWILFLVVLVFPSACVFAKNLDQQLIAAAKRGDATHVENLIERGANVNAREKNGQLTLRRCTALMWAAYNGHMPVVAILLAHDAEVDACDDNQRTALILAAERGHKDIAQRLLVAGANIRAVSKEKDTVLIVAARGGHETTVKWLLGKGVAVNSANDMGETALMAAALRGHTGTVKALLSGGARIDVVDTMGNNALILASTGVLYRGGGSAETVRLLLTHGANVNISNNKGLTALIGAASRGNTDAVKELLSAGADTTVKISVGKNKGETALSLALRNNHQETAELLQTCSKSTKR